MGKIYEITYVCAPQKKVLHKQLGGKQANLKTRNFPMPIKDLKKKLGLKDGGSSYVFACTLLDDSKVVLVCEKVNQEKG